MIFDYREDTEGTVDTWEIMDQQAGDNPGNFEVPPGVSRLTRVDFGVAPDVAVAAIVRLATMFRLQGTALNTPFKPWYGVGPAGGHAGTSNGQSFRRVPWVTYYTNIPVTPGDTWEAAFKFVGEDFGDVHGFMNVYYDHPIPPGEVPVKFSDVRESDLTDANTQVRIDTDPDGNDTTDFQSIQGATTLHELRVAVGMDVASVTRFAHEVEIDGRGLLTDFKPRQIAAVLGYQGLATESAEDEYYAPERVPVGILTDRQRTWFAQGQMVEDDYGAGTMVLGASYI